MHKSVKFILPLFALAFLLVSCSKTPATTTDNSSSSVPSMPSSEAATTNPAAAAALAKARADFGGQLLTGKHHVIIKTAKGDITVELDANAAPKAVTNFVLLAKAGFYDGLLFHRVIPDFMIQGGDPNGQGTGGESIFGPTFEDEINAKSYGIDKQTVKDVAQGQEVPPELLNLTIKELYEKEGYVYSDTLQSLPMSRGALAMANRGPNTNGSQFFIIQRKDGTDWLNGKHTVFGNVTSGMDVVDQLVAVPRDSNDMPTEKVAMTVTVID